MKNPKLLLCAAVAANAIFGLCAASAADIAARPYTKAPAMVANPVYNWTGFYIGANAGYGNARTSANSPDGTIGDSFLVGFSDSYGGFTGGIQAGYNWQFVPNWVFGIEGDVGYLGTRRQALDTTPSPPGFHPGLQTTVKSDFYSTIRGRFGYAWDRSLLYATGGVAFVRIKDGFDCCNFPVDFDTTERAVTKTGWTVGGGFETAISSNWTAKVEYLYIDAGKINVAQTDDSEPDTMQFRHQFHIVKFGLNYKFGGPVVAKY